MNGMARCFRFSRSISAWISPIRNLSSTSRAGLARNRAISASRRSTSALVGRRSARRRLMLTRIVRSTARFGVVPSLEYPARRNSRAVTSLSVALTRSGSSRSSNRMSRNSVSLSANENGSSPLPESDARRPPSPAPPPPLGLSMRSPATKSLLPGSTYSRSPLSRERWNCGSLMPSVGIETAPPLPASVMERSATALSTARLTSARVRRRNRWRLPRLLSRGLRRRSTNCAMLSGLVDPHVPLDQTADLALGVAARFHPIEEIGVLLLGLGVLLGPEADDRQQVFDLAEHALLDHLTDLLIGGPRGILALVGGAGAQRELDDLVAEVLGIGDAGRLLRLGKLRVEHLPVEDLSGVRILEVLLLDPGVGVGDVPVEQVLPIFAVGFDVGLLDFTADELGVARREVRLDEVEIAVLDVLRILLALDRLLKHVHQMDGIGGDLLVVEVEGLGQHLEGEAGGDARHPLRDARRLAVFLHRLRLGVGVLEALAVVDAQ